MAWIKCSERLPDEDEQVDVWLVVHPSPGSFGIGDSWREVEVWREGTKWFHYEHGDKMELRSELITHWQPIPKPPEMT